MNEDTLIKLLATLPIALRITSRDSQEGYAWQVLEQNGQATTLEEVTRAGLESLIAQLAEQPRENKELYRDLYRDTRRHGRDARSDLPDWTRTDQHQAE